MVVKGILNRLKTLSSSKHTHNAQSQLQVKDDVWEGGNQLWKVTKKKNTISKDMIVLNI